MHLKQYISNNEYYFDYQIVNATIDALNFYIHSMENGMLLYFNKLPGYDIVDAIIAVDTQAEVSIPNITFKTTRKQLVTNKKTEK